MDFKPIPDRPPTAKRVLKGVAALTQLSIVLGLFVLAVTNRRHETGFGSGKKLTKLSAYVDSHAVHSTLVVSYKNKYSERDGLVGRHLEWLEGNYLAEPLLPTELYLVDYDPNKQYQWEVWSVSDDEEEDIHHPDAIYYGHSFRETWDEVGQKLVIVNEYTTTEQGDRWLSDTAAGILYIRYVRREIRALMEEDRETLLDAMALHWQVGDKEGQELYGDRYRSMETLLMYHLQQAGAFDCDHYHDGYGFLTQHGAITLLFEQSLQAVNPALALPYWDYIQDMELFQKAGEGFRGFTNGPLFTAEYFGSTDVDNHIADGRWAGLRIPTVDDVDPENVLLQGLPHNSYGALRAPWSNNADPMVVRAAELCGADPAVNPDGPSTCSALAELQAQPDLGSWLALASYAPHGPVHIMTGGMLQCQEVWDALYPLGWDRATVDYYKGFHFGFHKNAYRYGVLSCEDVCYCPEFETYMRDEKALGAMLKQMGVELVDGYSDYTLDQRKAIANAICNSGAVNGDNLQASSSFTPEFWPIHGLIERAYQLKMMNSFEDDVWLWEEGTASWALTQQNCTGHFPNNVVLHRGDDTSTLTPDTLVLGGVERTTTNQELMEMLDPQSSALPYIYDSLVFDSCGGYEELSPAYSW
mmetsp:Transcript_27920/g.48438  ORF Transcript_27920/g.48438 Transcript_27920/m.48438 type:complete len:641 (+) Transcript_27920:157-2079(+)